MRLGRPTGFVFVVLAAACSRAPDSPIAADPAREAGVTTDVREDDVEASSAEASDAFADEGAPVMLDDASPWKLIWSDEFDDAGAPDPARWTFDVHGPGWVNDELENYTARPENARVENGLLVIETRHDDFDGHPYSSARLNSARKGDLLYGRVEVRA